MSILLGLTVSIGLLAVVATWIFLGPLAAMGLQIWQAFVAWACFYHSGGKTDRADEDRRLHVVRGAGRHAVGDARLGQLGGLGALAAPVAVGIGAACIVLAAHLTLLSTIPASVYGFACVAGLILLGKDMTPMGAIVPTIGSIIIWRHLRMGVGNDRRQARQELRRPAPRRRLAARGSLDYLPAVQGRWHGTAQGCPRRRVVGACDEPTDRRGGQPVFSA